MLDDSVIPPNPQKPKATLRKHVLSWTLVVVVYALVLGMVWLALTLLSSAIRPGVSLDDRVLKLLGAAALLVLPGNAAWTFIKRKRSTGSWFVMTEQEKARKAALRSAGQCSTTPGGVCGRPYRSWMMFSLCWAGYFAWQQNAALWKRTLAWTVIVLHAAFVLSLAGFGVLCIGASFADGTTARQQLFLFSLG